MIFIKVKNSFKFSSSNNFYDLICIGPAAQKVSSLIAQQNSKILFKKVFFKYLPYKHESNLAIFSQDKIQLLNKNKYFTTKLFKNKDSLNHLNNIDIKLKNQIKKIDPTNNKILLTNGQQIKYKYLIYSGDDHQWKDISYVNGLQQAVQNQSNSTFVDFPCSKTQSIYSKMNQTVYFSIPKEIHFGYDNYFMVHLLDSLRKTSKKYNYPDISKTKVVVLNQGSKFIPFNQEINQIVLENLQKSGVEVRNNVKIQSLDHRNKQFIINKSETVYYGALFQYLPRKTPQILSQNNIDPFNVNIHTLKNKQFPNIYCIGNIVPTTFSFYTLNYMNRVIAKNITNIQLQNNKTIIYEGDSIFPFYTAQNQLRYFTMNYQKTKSWNNIGQNQRVGKLLALDRKFMNKRQIDFYYNSWSYGVPYYIGPSKLKQQIHVKTQTKSKVVL